jgi:hypothetical protein
MIKTLYITVPTPPATRPDHMMQHELHLMHEQCHVRDIAGVSCHFFNVL